MRSSQNSFTLVSIYRRYSIFANYSTASIILSIANVAASLLILRWVDPKDYGLWLSLLIIEKYSTLVQAGITNGLNRELPYQYGRGNRELARQLASTAQGLTSVGAGLLLFSAVIAPFFIHSRVAGWTVAVILSHSAIGLVRNYLGSTYRAGREFATLTKLAFYETALTVLSLPLVCYHGYWGLVGRAILIQILAFVPLYMFRPLKVHSRLDLQSAARLCKVGLPIFSFSYLFGISSTFPKLILLQHGGTELVGLFAPAFGLMTVYTTLPTVVAKYVYPHMSFRLGRTEDPRSIWPIALKTAVGSIAIGALLMITGWFAIGPFIAAFLTRYTASIPATRWCLIAGVFLGPRIAVNALFALKAWKLAGVYTAVLVASIWIFPWLGSVYHSNPLVGVAQGICASYFVVFVCAMICVYKSTHRSSFSP